MMDEFESSHRRKGKLPRRFRLHPKPRCETKTHRGCVRLLRLATVGTDFLRGFLPSRRRNSPRR